MREKLVDKIMKDLMIRNGFPNIAPVEMSVIGGDDSIRREIIDRLYKELPKEYVNCKIKNGLRDIDYKIDLNYFIARHDSTFSPKVL